MVYEYIQTLTVSATFAASTPANTQITTSIVVDPRTGTTQNVITVPATQEWFIEDTFIRTSADVGVDAIMGFTKNGVKILALSQPLSSLLISNPSRPRLPPMFFEPNSRLSIFEVNLTAVGASAVTNTSFIQVRVRDSTF